MESEDDYSEDNSEIPQILGLEAFDLDYQYARFGPSLGLNTPSYEMGPLRLVPQLEMDQWFSQLQGTGRYVIFAVHSIWHTVLFWLLKRLATSHFHIFWLSWWDYVPEPKAVPMHLFMLLCSDPPGWRKLTLLTSRYLTRRIDPRRETMIFTMHLRALLLYGVGSLICHNIRLIFFHLLRPIALLPIGLLCLYALGIAQLIFHRCKAFLVAILGHIWAASMKLRREFYVEHQKYTRGHDQHGMANLYPYAEVGPSEIRLVELCRSHPLARLTVRLITYSLQSAPPYEAISYTWGDDATSHSILINGYLLSVNRNAFQVLHAMAPIWGSRLVWIDSVCINQQDPLDKNQQVPLMSKIYQQATRTLAWLGDSSNAENAVLQLYRLRPAGMSEQACHEVIDIMKQKRIGVDTSPNWSAMSELLSHKYWTRVWIIQELAMSKHAYVIYGLHYIPLGIVAEAAHTLNKILDEYNKGEHFQMSQGFERASNRIQPSQEIDQRTLNLLNIKIITEFRELVQEDQYPELWRAVEVTSLFNATDPRDKIYACFNIATYSTDSGLNADYTLSVNDVFMRFTKHYIRMHLQKVFIAAENCRPRQLEDLPSWVPDFTSSKSMPLPGQGGLVPYLKDDYTASGEQHHANTTIALDSGNGLPLRGVCVDLIAHLTLHAMDPSLGEAHDTAFHPTVNSWHQEAVSLVADHIPVTYRCYEESQRQALLRTLIGDRNSDGSEAQKIYSKCYKHWCHFLKLSAAAEDSVGSKNLDLSTQTANHETAARRQGAEIFASAVLRAAKFRRFAITGGGYMALVPNEVEVGDVIWVIAGLQVPVVLRPVAGMNTKTTKEPIYYTLVGWCYCHGIMMGEAVKNGAEFLNLMIR